MSIIPLVSCVVCGGEILESTESPSWMNQFVAVYSCQATSASAISSGLGRRSNMNDTVRITSLQGQELNVQVSLMYTDFDPSNYHGDVWGFPFHCSCWELLIATSPSGDIDIQTLFDLCRSFPATENTLDFGHDYGGIHKRVDMGHPANPGEEAWLCLDSANMADPVAFEARLSDPLNMNLTTGAINRKVSNKASASPKLDCKTATACDIFGKFPVELLILILLELTSVDVLNSKLSSRVIANVSLSDRFWHSRFCHGREFEFLFEFSQYAKYRGQWRDVYSLIQRAEDHPSVTNRKRIWGLATGIHTLLTQMGPCHGRAIRSWFEPDARPDRKTWMTASRLLMPDSSGFEFGSRVLYDRHLALPEMLSSISISIAQLFTGCYISGIQIRDTDGHCCDLGYFRPQHSVKLYTTCIVGFLLAQDQRGIRGIRMLSGDHSSPSPWVGQYEGIPQRKLVLPRTTAEDGPPISEVRGGFDACKMVSLAILGNAGSPNPFDDLNHPLCLQDTAIWFPEIPPSDLCFFGLAEQSSSEMAEQFLLDEVKWLPFQVSLFSNIGGGNTSHVNGIRILRSINKIICLIMDLDKPLHGRTYIYHGVKESTLEQLREDEVLEEHDFIISSTEGERIIGLDVYEDRRGGVISIKVHTNFGRSSYLPPGHEDRSCCAELQPERLWPETGHIVGFYGIVSGYTGLVNLGVVCNGDATLKQFISRHEG